TGAALPRRSVPGRPFRRGRAPAPRAAGQSRRAPARSSKGTRVPGERKIGSWGLRFWKTTGSEAGAYRRPNPWSLTTETRRPRPAIDSSTVSGRRALARCAIGAVIIAFSGSACTRARSQRATASAPAPATAARLSRRVIVFIWDGLRPDSVDYVHT